MVLGGRQANVPQPTCELGCVLSFALTGASFTGLHRCGDGEK